MKEKLTISKEAKFSCKTKLFLIKFKSNLNKLWLITDTPKSKSTSNLKVRVQLLPYSFMTTEQFTIILSA